MAWDNRRNLGLVMGQDFFSVLPPELTTLKLYMPLTADLFEPLGFEDRILAVLVKERMPEEAKLGIMHWYHEGDSVDDKIHSEVFSVEEREGKLWGVAEFWVKGELTPILAVFLNHVRWAL